MQLEQFIKEMPKVELHVHLEGSLNSGVVQKLSQKNDVILPDIVTNALRKDVRYDDFSDFIQVFRAVGRCICSEDDVEYITREFLIGQAAQNIVYSEVTYTPILQYYANNIGYFEQINAINKARKWGKQQLGVDMRLIILIPRHLSAEEGELVAEWAIESKEQGVVALGLGGTEIGNPPEKFTKAFALAREAGLASIPHAGEIVGAVSMWGAIRELIADRIGHGVLCLEDSELVDELRESQLPLEVCPGSNVSLRVVDNLGVHPIDTMLKEGLFVTINSDDPALFGTSLTDEYLNLVKTFGYDQRTLELLSRNAIQASLLPDEEKKGLFERFEKFVAGMEEV